MNQKVAPRLENVLLHTDLTLFRALMARIKDLAQDRTDLVFGSN